MPGNKNSGQQYKVIENTDTASDAVAKVAIVPEKKKGGWAKQKNNMLREH